MQHFTHISDLGVAGVERVLDLAARLKAHPSPRLFAGKILGMLFFNPSLRTRVSFEAAMIRGGGSAIVLDVGGGIWQLEDRLGVRMDGDRPEHIKEAVPVLARYVDALAVRTFAKNADQDEDERDTLLKRIREYSTVPVVSMESAREHPCQGLADMLTLREKLGGLRGCPVTLTWAPHIKPLPLAVPHSFLLSAAACGCAVTVAHPPGFELHPRVLAEAQALAAESGASLRVIHDQQEACHGAAAVYAKSWSPRLAAVAPADPAALYAQHSAWMVDLPLLNLGGRALFMHCLPVRRNVVATDAVLDSPQSIVTDEAENRLHAQRAVLHELFSGEADDHQPL